MFDEYEYGFYDDIPKEKTMSSIYKDLDVIISDYVGYKQDDEEYDEEGMLFNNYSCADPLLYDNITKECSAHLKGSLSFKDLSEDAKNCIRQWESLMAHYTEYENKLFNQ